MNRRAKLVAVVGLIAVVTVSISSYQMYYSAERRSCPGVFATVSFENARGFVTTVHPTPQTTEFVLKPNSTGEITVSYSSPTNNFTMSSITRSFNDLTARVPVWEANLTTGSLDNTLGLNVSRTSLTLVNSHLVLGNYTIAAGPSSALYVLGFPSTCLTTIVYVGNQPYSGPLPWLNGARA